MNFIIIIIIFVRNDFDKIYHIILCRDENSFE